MSIKIHANHFAETGKKLLKEKKLLKQIPSSEPPSTSSAAASVRASFRPGSIITLLPPPGAVEESRLDCYSANVGIVTC